MMKQILSTLFASTTLLIAADLSMQAWSQTSKDQTTQTDKSEEDWRKSRKKTTSDDIFEDILNRRSTGSGYGMGPENPIDSLPEESRRHLMNERAKIIATSEPGQPVTTPYTPSDAAKSDTDLQAQEKEAWDKIVNDMNGGSANGQTPSQMQGQGQTPGQGNGQAQNQNQSQSGSPGGSPSGQAGSPSQSGQPSQSNDSGNSPSPLRGGSSASVSDILAKIKGLQTGSGTVPAGGDTGSPKAPSIQNGTGQTPAAQTAGQSAGGDQNSAPVQGQTQAQSQSQTTPPTQDQSSAESATQSQAQGKSQDGSQGESEAAAQAHAHSHGAAPQSPLDRIQARKRNAASQTSGKRTSASDYLKTSD